MRGCEQKVKTGYRYGARHRPRAKIMPKCVTENYLSISLEISHFHSSLSTTLNDIRKERRGPLVYNRTLYELEKAPKYRSN